MIETSREYPYLAILVIFVTIFIIIDPYLAKYTLILPYLPLFGNILPMFTL